jgi:hypothetical protein
MEKFLSTDNRESPKLLEKKKEQVPEIVLKEVKDKVTDLYESGYALNALRPPQGSAQTFEEALPLLQSTLEKGLLGVFEANRRHSEGEWKDRSIVEKFLHFARKERTGVVMGNVIGRDVEGDYHDGIFGYFRSPLSIVFDISDKKEVIHGPHSFDQDNQKNGNDEFDEKSKNTRIGEMWGKHDGSMAWNVQLSKKEVQVLADLNILDTTRHVTFEELRAEILSKENELSKLIDFGKLKVKLDSCKSYADFFNRVHSDNGFVLGRRIAPRKFTGVIWKASSRNSFEEQKAEDLEQIERIVHTFSSVSDTAEKNRFLPVYDQWGNLWWPEKMSREEIIKIKKEEELKEL